MSKPNILIIGTGTLLNYGCEAIVHGTYNIIRNVFPECTITVASDDLDYDEKVLPSDVKLVKYRQRFTPYRIFKGILRRVFKIGDGSAVRMNTSIGKDYDIVLSCGGDNYCERPDHGIYDILVDLMKICSNTSRKGKKYVLWGASVGPFHNPDIEKDVVSNLSLCSGLFVREELSYKYLSQFKELSSKLHLVADPAFQMNPLPVDFKRDEGKIYVGINMSELAVRHSGLSVDNSKVIFAKIIDEILEKDSRLEMVFIPHVNEIGPQYDMNFLLPVYENSCHKERIHIIQPGLGARKTKGLISQLDLLVAARMHCCVGGISVGTPTLFITYSNKGKGMSLYAYGHHDYEVACNEIFNDKEILESKIKLMLEKSKEIRDNLIARSDIFNSDSMKAGIILKKSIE